MTNNQLVMWTRDNLVREFIRNRKISCTYPQIARELGITLNELNRIRKSVNRKCIHSSNSMRIFLEEYAKTF